MQSRVLTVDGTSFPVVATRDGFRVVRADLFLAVLVVDDAAAWAANWGIAPIDGETARMRHGLNTRSLLAPEGVWVVCSPWVGVARRLVAQAADTGALGCASVARQWRPGPAGIGPLAERLVPGICRQVPRWPDLSPRRQAVVRREIDRLVRRFMEAGPMFPMAPDDPEFDRYPGLALVPDRPAWHDDALASADIEASDGPGDRSADVALDYWWQSVFTMWWKGFW